MAEFTRRATVAKDPEAFGSDYEKIEAIWVCLACGYMEDIDIEAEGTPAHSKDCPDCGAMLYRLNGVSLFHLGFTDTDSSATVQGVEAVDDKFTADGQTPDLVQRSEPETEEPIDADAVLKIKSRYDVWNKKESKVLAKDSVMVFRAKPGRAKDFLERVETLRKIAPTKIWRMLRAEADLLEVDGQPLPVRRFGVFGSLPGAFLERYTRNSGFSLVEARRASVRFISDNGWKLVVEVEGQRLAFQPRKGFPFDHKQVSPTVFEDFVRRFKNLRADRGRALAFLQSSGELVEGASGPVLKEVTVVKPSSRAAFSRIAEALDINVIYWYGTPSRMVVDKELDTVRTRVAEVDSKAEVMQETTTTADVDPGFVVTKNQVPHYDKFKSKIEQSVGGKVIELGVAPSGGLTFVYESDNTPETWRRAHNLVLMMGDPFPVIFHENGTFKIALSISPDQIQIHRMGV